jgi:Metallo-beta-lactamase superfamily
MPITAFQGLSWRVPLGKALYLVLAPNQERFPFANSFFIAGRETVLLDAGIGTERIRELDRRCRIDVLIISHSHPDHIHAWHELADRHLLLPRETPESAFDLRRLGHRITGSVEKGDHWARKMGEWLGLHPLREPDDRYENNQELDLCRIPRTADLLVAASPFYNNRFPDRRLQQIFETQLVVKNLERLVDDGWVIGSRGTYRWTDGTTCGHGIHQEKGEGADNE